jgi:hypothetical protein
MVGMPSHGLSMIELRVGQVGQRRHKVFPSSLQGSSLTVQSVSCGTAMFDAKHYEMAATYMAVNTSSSGRRSYFAVSVHN